MSRLTEAMERQASLDRLTGDDFKAEAEKQGITPLAELQHGHYTVIDLMLQNPRISTRVLAEKSGYSMQYLNKLRRTPLFIIAYEESVQQIHTEFKGELLQEVGKTTKDMLTSLSEIFCNDSESAKDKISAAKLLIEGDAFSLFKGKQVAEQPAAVNVNVNQSDAGVQLGVTREMLQEANRKRLDKYKDEEVVDGEVQSSSVQE